MTDATCPHCHRPSDGLPCHDCTNELRRGLQDVPWLLDQLDVTASRQTRMSIASGSTSRTAERPLPVDLTAAGARAELAGFVAAWADEFGGKTIPARLDTARSALHAALRARNEGTGRAEAHATLVRTRAADVRRLASEYELLADRGPGSARWMLGHVDAIRAHPQAGVFIGALLEAVQQPTADKRGGNAYRIIDHPVERIPLGDCAAAISRPDGQSAHHCMCSCHQNPAYPPPCDHPGGCGSLGCRDGLLASTETVTCPRALYAEPGDPVVTCPACGTQHDVRQRRDRALDNADYVQGRATHLAGILKLMGVHCSAALIRKYAHRRRITATFIDEGGNAWYRLGDVRAALRQPAIPEQRTPEPTSAASA